MGRKLLLLKFALIVVVIPSILCELNSGDNKITTYYQTSSGDLQPIYAASTPVKSSSPQKYIIGNAQQRDSYTEAASESASQNVIAGGYGNSVAGTPSSPAYGVGTGGGGYGNAPAENYGYGDQKFHYQIMQTPSHNNFNNNNDEEEDYDSGSSIFDFGDNFGLSSLGGLGGGGGGNGANGGSPGIIATIIGLKKAKKIKALKKLKALKFLAPLLAPIFGPLLLPILLPILVVIFLPILLLLLLPLLFLPIPVITIPSNTDSFTSGGFFRSKNLKSVSTARLAKEILSSDECIERIACQIASFTSKFETGKRLIEGGLYLEENTQIGSSSPIVQRVSRAIKTEGTCGKFTCNPMTFIRKNLTF